jgi:ubiquinol-cytochrome c reductase cytochrome c1 subunit
MLTKKLAALALALLPVAALAAESGAHLEHANTDIHSTASLQRGARNFVNYCMGCHSARYVRWNRVAQDLDIPLEDLRRNLMFAGGSEHSTIQSAMPAEDAKRWFGNAPPDLSLIARSRSPDYLFTFLKSFYADESRPAGVNNVALPGTAMPHVLAPLQGVQQARYELRPGAGGAAEKHLVGLEAGTPGELTGEQYDEFVRDTVNFLDYIGEPAKAKREDLGVWVILFLLLFFGLAYMLKQEYWKDVK